MCVYICLWPWYRWFSICSVCKSNMLNRLYLCHCVRLSSFVIQFFFCCLLRFLRLLFNEEKKNVYIFFINFMGNGKNLILILYGRVVVVSVEYARFFFILCAPLFRNHSRVEHSQTKKLYGVQSVRTRFRLLNAMKYCVAFISCTSHLNRTSNNNKW